jgi:hypothetical protein
MKLDTKTPCASCPYRKDVPVKTWHRSEFENLLAQDQDQFGRMFGCHKFRFRPSEEQHFCAGWLLDQKERGYPSLHLRMFLITNGITVEQLDEITSGGLDLYPTIKAMCLANGVRKAKEKPPSERLSQLHVKHRNQEKKP